MDSHRRCPRAYGRRIHYSATIRLWEKRVAVSFICIVSAEGSWLLYNLQCHLRNIRLAIDWRDTNPLWRGAEIVIGMWIALGASAAAVCYSLWRDGAVHRLLLTMQDQVY